MNLGAFFSEIRKSGSGLFGATLSPAQVTGMENILAASERLPVSHRAYLLATAYHETGRRMLPVREAFGASDDETIARLERAWQSGNLPQVKRPYWRRDKTGRAWFGRGYVQITHKANYERVGKAIGRDLVGSPDLALAPDIAAEILVVGCERGLFTGKKLSDFLPGDYIAARKVVNGLDRANLIAGYAESFERALLAAEAPNPKPAPERLPLPSPAVGIAAALAALVAGVAAWFGSLEAWINSIFGG